MELRIENRTKQSVKVRVLWTGGMQDYADIPAGRDSVGKLVSGYHLLATFPDGRHPER
jgi:hypothetical protein